MNDIIHRFTKTRESRGNKKMWSWLQDTSRRQIKSFSVQQFFKNAAEVWASSPHLRSKSNCTMKRNKNLRENRKNRNCLQNQKVVMKDKVSGAIAIPKASWGCATALPNRTQVVFLRKRKTKQEVSNKRCMRKYQINLIKFSTVI